jgi:hypothetical protein
LINLELSSIQHKSKCGTKRESGRTPDKPPHPLRPSVKYNTIVDSKIKSNSMLNNYPMRGPTISMKKVFRKIAKRKTSKL